MSQRDLVAELRAARVAAPPQVRERVRLIAATAELVPPRRFLRRRSLVLLVPVAAAARGRDRAHDQAEHQSAPCRTRAPASGGVPQRRPPGERHRPPPTPAPPRRCTRPLRPRRARSGTAPGSLCRSARRSASRTRSTRRFGSPPRSAAIRPPCTHRRPASRAPPTSSCGSHGATCKRRWRSCRGSGRSPRSRSTCRTSSRESTSPAAASPACRSSSQPSAPNLSPRSATARSQPSRHRCSGSSAARPPLAQCTARDPPPARRHRDTEGRGASRPRTAARDRRRRLLDRDRRRLRARVRPAAAAARPRRALRRARDQAPPGRRAAQPALSWANTRNVGSPTGSSENSGLMHPSSSSLDS